MKGYEIVLCLQQLMLLLLLTVSRLLELEGREEMQRNARRRVRLARA